MGPLLLKDIKTIAAQKSVYVLISLIMVLFIVNGVLYSFRYSEQASYHNRLLARYPYTNPVARFIVMPPNPLQFCCDNDREQLTIQYFSSLSGLYLSTEIEQTTNKFVSAVKWLDWTNLVKVLFSLLMIVMAHNLISNELEKKTLSLMCSYSISRWQIYCAKLFSVIIVTPVILLLAMMVGLVSIIATGLLPINATILGMLLLFFVISMTYCSFFCVVGIAVSSIAKRSTVSLTALIFIWIMSVIVIPESITFAVKKQFQEQYGYDYASLYMHVNHKYMEELSRMEKRADQLHTAPENERNGMIDEIKRELNAIAIHDNEEHYRVTVSSLRDDLAFMNTLNRWLVLSPSTLYQILAEKTLKSGNTYFTAFVEEILSFTSSFREDMYNRYNTYSTYSPSVNTIVDGKEIKITTEVPEFKDNGMQFSFDSGADISAATLQRFCMLGLYVLLALIYGFMGFVRLDVR